jgi:hypothetical protein
MHALLGNHRTLELIGLKHTEHGFIMVPRYKPEAVKRCESTQRPVNGLPTFGASEP